MNTRLTKGGGWGEECEDGEKNVRFEKEEEEEEDTSGRTKKRRNTRNGGWRRGS